MPFRNPATGASASATGVAGTDGVTADLTSLQLRGRYLIFYSVDSTDSGGVTYSFEIGGDATEVIAGMPGASSTVADGTGVALVDCSGTVTLEGTPTGGNCTWDAWLAATPVPA